MGLKSNLEIENHQIYTTTTPKTDKGIGRASNPISVVNPNGADETPTDKLIVNSSETTAKSTDSRSAKEINQSIAVMCQKYSLDVKKLKTGIENITGLVSDNDKSKLTEKQQAVLFSIIENSMQKAIQVKETGKRDDIDVVEAVLFDALLTSEIIIKKKTFKDLKSLDNDVQENATELLDAINNIKSVEEFEALKGKFEAQMKEKFEKEKAAIQKLPENERAEAIELLKAKHQARRQRLLSHYIFPNASKEVSANALTIANSEDTGRITTGLYKMQASDKDRQELAVKYHSFGLDEKILKAQKERGEEFNQESWQEYVEVNTSWKDETSLTEYHNQVMSAAKEGKLAEEVVKATHKGIGVGAQINHVMTSEQKTAFVEKWTSDVKEYYGEDSKEYKELKSYVEQKVEEYNKALQNKSEGGINKSSQGESTKQASVSYGRVTDPFNANRMLAASVQSQFTKSVTPDANKKSYESTNAVLSSTSSPKDIAKAIETGEITIVEALSKCKEKGYEAIFESPDLFAKNKTIADLYIGYNKKDLKKMLELSNFSSAVALIAKRISPTIKDEYQQKVQLSWTERQAIFGEENKHEVV